MRCGGHGAGEQGGNCNVLSNRSGLPKDGSFGGGGECECEEDAEKEDRCGESGCGDKSGWRRTLFVRERWWVGKRVCMGGGVNVGGMMGVEERMLVEGGGGELVS